jgi:hypothetical protein
VRSSVYSTAVHSSPKRNEKMTMGGLVHKRLLCYAAPRSEDCYYIFDP